MHETHQNPPVDDKEKIKLFNANCNLRKISKKKLWIFQGSNFCLFDVQERHH